MQKICLIFLLVWSTSTTTFAQGEWTAYTATGGISKIIRRGNTLWMAATGGLIQWNLADNTYIKYTTLDGLPHLYLRDMVMDSAGTLWICSEGGGVTAYDGKNWTTFSEPEGLPSDDVFCAEIDRQGNKWFGTMEGLAKYDGNNWVTFPRHENIRRNRIWSIVSDHSGALWVSTYDGISTYNQATWTFVDSLFAESLTIDLDNNLWVSGFGLIGKYDRTDWEFYSLGPLIEVDQVQTSAVDSTNIKWFGSYTGLWRFDDSTVVHFTTDDGLPYNSVTDIYVDSLNNKWIGTPRGFSKFDGQTWTNYRTNTILTPRVPVLVVDRNNHLWASTYHVGVAVFDGENWQTYTEADGLIEGRVNAIAIDRYQNKWFGTSLGGGVSKFDGTNWTSYSIEDGLADRYVNSIVIGVDDRVWFATENGLSCFDGENWKTFTRADGLHSNSIHCLAVDRQGMIWAGSYVGLSRYDGNVWKIFTAVDGLPLYSVPVIEVENENTIWFGGWEGVAKYDGTHFEMIEMKWVNDIAVDSTGVKWFACQDKIVRYTESGSEIFTGKKNHLTDDTFLSVVVDAKNVKWFGTEAGGILKYTEFPDKITLSPKPTHFTISGNYPNPFNAATQFEYTLPGQTAQPVEIKIFDVLGRQVRLLFHGMQPGGHHRISWDGTDVNGNACVSGIYLVLFEVNRQRVLRKVSLIK